MDIALELCSLRSASWALKPLAVPYANFGGPQTLNLYTYVENSPLNRIDADGHTQPTGSGQGYNQDASGRMPVKADCPAWDVCPPRPPDPDKATNAAQNKKDPPKPAPATKASTGERVAMALAATANVIVGAPKAVAGATMVAAAAAPAAPTVVGAVALGASGTYELAQGTAQLQSANLQIKAAISGNTDGVDDQVDRLTVSTSISGSVATSLNGGDYHAGAKWAAVEGLASGSLKRDLFEGIGNIIDTVLSAKGVVTP